MIKPIAWLIAIAVLPFQSLFANDDLGEVVEKPMFETEFLESLTVAQRDELLRGLAEKNIIIDDDGFETINVQAMEMEKAHAGRTVPTLGGGRH